VPVRFALYNAALSAAVPVAKAYLRATKHRPLLARFDPPAPAGLDRPVWIQGCSVGEAGLALTLGRALAEQRSDLPVLLSASTATGHGILADKAGELPHTWFPFDAPGTVRRFLDQVNPRMLVLIETEIWPNVLLACRRRKIPVVIVNGRLSERHFARYSRAPRFFGPVFGGLTAVGVQSEQYAGRFEALGVSASALTLTGNMKFDGVATEITPERRSALRRSLGFGREPVLVFGSTRPGDEALALACHAALRQAEPTLRLVIVPRHVQRADEIAALAPGPWARRSAMSRHGAPDKHAVVLVDTIGELTDFYSIATAAVVGGSFYPGVEGHNPLEPAALGTPTFFGPHMKNFQEAADVLIETRGAVGLSQPDQLVDALGALLNDSAEQRQLGTRGRKAVLDNRGATTRNIELIASVLEEGQASA